MSYYSTLRREISQKIDEYKTAGRILNADWITTEICSAHDDGLAENDDADFWRHGGQRTVRNEVRETINKLHGDKAQASDRQAFLPGFKHLQSHYMVERGGDEVGVPSWDLTETEIRAKADLYRSMGAACYEHADELERFIQFRNAAE